MSYSESELDSNFAINSVSDFDSASESGSESESSFSVYESWHLHFFLLYICILLNKLADNFLSIFITESIVMQPMQV